MIVFYVLDIFVVFYCFFCQRNGSKNDSSLSDNSRELF